MKNKQLLITFLILLLFLLNVTFVYAPPHRHHDRTEGQDYIYENLAVNSDSGTLLEGFPSATRVQISAYNINWHYSKDANSLITTPEGKGGRGGGGYIFPNLHKYGIVIGNGYDRDARNITDVDGIIEIDLTGDYKPIIYVNDNGFSDNWGSFCIKIKKLR